VALNTLNDFLASKNHSPDKLLPFIHTTRSLNIENIIDDMKIEYPKDCKFFKERLVYLFMGRPAFKWEAEIEEPYWALPMVLIWRHLPSIKIRRIYPFDSGAFLSSRMPDYITLIPLDKFNLGSDVNAIEPLVSVYFGEKERYFRGGKDDAVDIKRQHILGPKDIPAEALNALYKEALSEKVDDRCRAIEVQVENRIELASNPLLGIIAPRPYEADPTYKAMLNALAPNVEYYDILPYRVQSYYWMLHDFTKKILTKEGLLRV
jgi:hypothetical protein